MARCAFKTRTCPLSTHKLTSEAGDLKSAMGEKRTFYRYFMVGTRAH